jgi:hypothetical protein
MTAISQVASGAASEAAIAALNQNDRAIQNARDANLRAGLTGDKSLVVRNFAGAVITKIDTEGGEVAGCFQGGATKGNWYGGTRRAVGPACGSHCRSRWGNCGLRCRLQTIVKVIQQVA